MDKVRVGVVGLGYFGSFHARHYAAHPDAVLVAIADPSDARGDLVRSTYGDIHVRDHREMIGRVDAVSIAAPTGLHHRIAGDFIDAGVPILVEKPLAATAATARDLVARAAAKALTLQVGHIERFSPAYRALRAAVTAPLFVEARRHALWTGRVTDVDVVLDLMIHDIDLVLDLVGASPGQVEASGVAMMGHGLDSVAARVSFANGVSAHISASRVAALGGRVTTVQEAGTTWTADLGARSLSAFVGQGAVKTTSELPQIDALSQEIQAFLDAVRGLPSDGVTGESAVAALDLAESIRAAAAA